MSKSKQPIKSTVALEPTRFVCEYCGSVSIVKKTSAFGDPTHFLCHDCENKSKYTYDKQQGIEVHINDMVN